MARDFEDLHDLDELSDRELRELVVNHLRSSNAIDVDDITVTAEDGIVTLEGRVGTDSERRISEHVLTDVLGIVDFRNNLVVDPIRRAESSEDIEDHLEQDERAEGLLLGDRPVPLSPEAEHLEEDVDAQLWGTTDVGRAIERGTAWIPPEAPTPEGLEGTEGAPSGEDH
jgi:BON domain